MITKVRLKNWKSHRNSEFEFTAGTNGLVGIVGSGKTSVLDAICFALFGTFPTLQTRKLKLEDIIMKKPVSKDSAEVEVFFTLNNNDYSVKRVIEKRRGTSYSEIKENGRVLESPSTRSVTVIVEKILKLNYELFSKAIYSEQNSIDYFLTLGKGQRMKKIDELLMIDRFEKARASGVRLTNKLIERRLGKESAIDQLDITKTKKALAELKKSIKEFEQERIELKKTLESISKRKKEVKDEVAKLNMIRNDYEKMMREDSGIESTINATLEMINKAEKTLRGIGETADVKSLDAMLKKHVKNIEETGDLLKEKQAEYERMQSKLASSKTNISFLQKEKISRLQEEFDEKMKIKAELGRMQSRVGKNVGRQIENKRIELQKLIGEIEAARMKTADLQEQLEKLSDVEGVCPVCGTDLSQERKKKIITKKREEVGDLKEKIKKARAGRITTEEKIQEFESAAKKIEEMLKDIVDLEEIKDELEESRHTLSHHKESLDIFNTQLRSLKEEIDATREKLEKATNTKQKLEIMGKQIKDYEQQKQKMEDLKRERKKMRVQIAKLENSLGEDRLEEAEQLLRKLIGDEKGVEMKLKSLGELKAERSARLTEYEQTVGTVKKEREEIDRLDKLIKDLKIFTEALKQTQSELRKEFVEAVNYTMNELWQTLYPYQDFVGIRLAIEEGDYVLQLQERTMSWVNVEGVASGGERSIACLALRIAFALVLAPQLRILFLDEPTANLDTNSVKVLANTLREKIAEFIDQCFVITHDEVFEEAVTGNAYRLERDKGKDGATRAIQIN